MCSHHIFLDHSESVRRLTYRFNYLGIVIPLWGTTVSNTYFGFRCESHLRHLYGLFASIAGLLYAIATLHPTFSGPTGRNMRTTMYLLLGMSSFLPIGHGVRLHGLEEHDRRIGLMYYVGLGLCHGSGAMLYAARMPEKWYPRCLDLVGSSYQLMHMLVFCVTVCYGAGILRANEYWRVRVVCRRGKATGVLHQSNLAGKLRRDPDRWPFFARLIESENSGDNGMHSMGNRHHASVSFPSPLVCNCFPEIQSTTNNKSCSSWHLIHFVL